MDEHSVELLSELIATRTLQLRAALPEKPRGHGAVLVTFIDDLLGFIDADREAILQNIGSADEDDQPIRARDLLLLKYYIDKLHELTPFLADVGRKDLPLGVVQLIHSLVEDLLGDRGADIVVHLSDVYMYSTLNVRAMVAEYYAPAAHVAQDPTHAALDHPDPIIFRVPSLDNANALLSPILAHEVGHVALRHRPQLLRAVLDRIGDDALEELAKKFPLVAPTGQHTRQLMQRDLDLNKWLVELICDAIATVLTGPSILLAAAVFLPAPQVGALGGHPYPADRVRLFLEHLDRLGWTEMMNSRIPAVTDWLQSIEQPHDASSPREGYLREAVQHASPHLLAVAVEAFGERRLGPDEFAAFDEESGPLFDMGVLPVQQGAAATSIWALVLLGWIHELSEVVPGGSLARSAADRNVNQFLLKGVEMSRIARLWSEA